MRSSVALLSSALLLAACSGGGGTTPVSVPLQPGNPSGGAPRSITVAKTYEVVDLGVNAYPYAINNNNDVVGTAPFNGMTNLDDAFLYASGKMYNLGTLPGATGSYASGINDAGTIIGTATGPGSNQTAAVFSPNAAPQSLGTGNGVASTGDAVNKSGELVGTVYSTTDGSSTSCFNQIAIFDGHGGAQQYESNARAAAVNASGTILYDVYHGISLNCREGTIGAALYPSNATVPFPSNASIDNGGSWAYDINDLGDVVGFYRDSNFNTAGFYYHNGTSIELLPSGYSGEGTGFTAYGINNAEVIVGTAGPSGVNTPPQGFAWYNGTFTDLNTRLAADCRNWTIVSARAINDGGYIVGTALLSGDTSGPHGVLLIPQS